VRRTQELQDHQASARSHHAPHLGQTLIGVRKIAQSESDGRRIEAGVVEWQAGGVTLHPFNRRLGGARDRQHALAEVEPDHPPAGADPVAQLEGQLPGAARDVQGTVGIQGYEVGDPVPPQSALTPDERTAVAAVLRDLA